MKDVYILNYGLYFDGQKDKILMQYIEIDAKYQRKTILDEHISIIQEGGSKYLGHVTPGGSAKETMKVNFNFLNNFF